MGEQPNNLGTVLVTEDNPDVRATTCMMLNKLGWKVLEAEDGAQALDMMDRHPEIDILLSDVIMPGDHSGYDLAKMLSERHNAPHVLLVSGYPDEPEAGNEAIGVTVTMLEKPFTMDRLQEELTGLMKES